LKYEKPEGLIGYYITGYYITVRFSKYTSRLFGFNNELIERINFGLEEKVCGIGAATCRMAIIFLKKLRVC